MTLETENEVRRLRSAEAGAEMKESKEGEKDKELESAAAMERADLLIREVKSSKKQMQNIVIHMQEVMNAIRQLRAQLQLAQTDDDAKNPSVAKDKERIDELKERISKYSDEVLKMKDELIRDQTEILREGDPTMTSETVRQKATQVVEDILKEITMSS